MNAETTMNPDAQREAALFQAAARLTGTARSLFLDGACKGDASLRRRLEALLAAHEQSEGVLAEAAPGAGGTRKVQITNPADQAIGQKVGRYKLLEQIGEGGFGVVYVAEQQEPVRRRVALKIIKLGMDTRQVVARFEAERQALALMDHPNIAKVFDAGATETGRPFFVMELVRGIPITDYCDQNTLSTRERIDLFVRVCQAIQHAHQKGIIHRDIKPSNILVTLHDGVPVPKVIDFGIAKATDQRLTDKTVYTAFHQFMGTPAYMSPEQAEMSGLDIDTRSDIYSLGVLLYELLTGKTPFDQKELLAAGVDAMRRIIREKEPARPSTRLSTMAEGELTTTAKRRQTAAPQLIHSVRGDLDWIVMKTLEKDRTRRYETATALAIDIKRYLSNEPVLARPQRGFYQLQKTVYRYRSWVLATSTIVLVMCALFLVQKSFARRTELRLRVVAADGSPIRGARCELIVGGYPTDARGFPLSPDAENNLTGVCDDEGKVVFRHKGLANDKNHIIYVRADGYSGATRFLDNSHTRSGTPTIVLFKKKRVTLRYVYQPDGTRVLDGKGNISGEVTLYPMEDGSYRPPARAFFSFKQNRVVGSGGVLDIGVELDQRGEIVYFGGSNGRFDHCTDLGAVPFGSVLVVDPASLLRERKDTPIASGHTYVYESNIYPPEQRTSFTGLAVSYAKIFVESVEYDRSNGAKTSTPSR
jgi:serine/threonine protein kinase